MLNNQNLKKKDIDYIPYDLQIGIFNAKCKQCPYAVYKVRRKTGLILTFKDYREAISYATDNRTPLHRFCTFNDEVITLSEIVQNHCMFWDNPPQDPEEDTEVRELTEESLADIQYIIYALKRSLAEFKE